MPKFGDFMVNETFTFEIGGPQKSKEQVHGIPNAFIVSDGITYSRGNKIPLWLFGFLY
ncbi:MAG: AAA family ATPase [Cyclobacteriaceae bacterium]|nr:AAA family ATPase [Cyclobacteriaceae bacterium]